MIEIKDVFKQFKDGDQTIAVKDVSLKVETGEIFGIIGYSGAGKSTLVRIINQLEKCDRGEILIDGVDITKLKGKKLREMRQKMGMIFQHFSLLWSRTVLENVLFPLEIAKVPKEERIKRAEELLKVVGLYEKKDVYPSSLSGGQKQRVGIARALALNPSILLCDEATSALDPKTTDDILELLKRINREYGITIIIITHQMEVVQKICHRMAVMEAGEVIEVGNTEDIFKSPNNPFTREMVQDVDTDLDDELKEKYRTGHLLRLTFDENSTNEPVLANLAIESGIKYSVVAASIKNMQAGAMGVMYILVDDNQDKIIELLEKKGVEVKEI